MKQPVTKILKNPRITEKASVAMEGNVYTFDISDSASKPEIARAVFEIYKVKPVRINVLSVAKKKVFIRGRKSSKGGGRKAYVELKEGDKIEFI